MRKHDLVEGITDYPTSGPENTEPCVEAASGEEA